MAASGPVGVGELGAIPDHDGQHRTGALGGLRRIFHFLAGRRGEANGQRKSVHERACDHPPSRCDCMGLTKFFQAIVRLRLLGVGTLII